MTIEGRRDYLPFVDWMKAIGIILIVVLHVATRPFLYSTPPIYAKQLGVAFFMFVLGLGLAKERRRLPEVLVRRLFDLYFWGLLCAVVMSVVMLVMTGRTAKSNYLPFFFGVNVAFNFFPANPTTWYIGMYLHALLLWGLLLRRVRVTLPVLAGVAVAEVAARAFLTEYAGAMVAYMAVTNWATVLLLGMWVTQQGEQGVPVARRASPWPWALCGVSALLAWGPALSFVVTDATFPWLAFRDVVVPGPFVVSVGVTVSYALFTWIVYRATAPVEAPSWVRFLARNTLLVFILHMPLYYALLPLLERMSLSYEVRSTVLLLVCLPVLAGVSEMLQRWVPTAAFRDRLSPGSATRGRASTAGTT